MHKPKQFFASANFLRIARSQDINFIASNTANTLNNSSGTTTTTSNFYERICLVQHGIARLFTPFAYIMTAGDDAVEHKAVPTCCIALDNY